MTKRRVAEAGDEAPLRTLNFGPTDGWPDLTDWVFLGTVLREVLRSARSAAEAAEDIESCWALVEDHGWTARTDPTAEGALIFLPSLADWAADRGAQVIVAERPNDEALPTVMADDGLLDAGDEGDEGEEGEEGEEGDGAEAPPPLGAFPAVKPQAAWWIDDKDWQLAALLDCVAPAQLEKMLQTVPPGSSQESRWTRYCTRAGRNRLWVARWERGRFNPYVAALWWLKFKAPPQWDWARCKRVLLNNLPARSWDSRHLFE